ncbi:MAG: electron transport complex subunit RsxA [Myxococcales bacterium]|nr:electron transport complex subunit RsxA [Myxococcales bacterium]
MTSLILLGVSAILVNNFVMSRFLGICPFLGVSKKIETAIGMGLAVIFVITLAGIVTWLTQYYILEPLGVGYLQTIAFILIIAALVQFVEMVILKISPVLYRALGIYLPLITTNCAVLGVAVLNIQKGYNFFEMLVFSISAPVGFTLVMVIFAGIRERMETSDIPESLQGTAIALITAGLLSLAFMGFAGLVKG